MQIAGQERHASVASKAAKASFVSRMYLQELHAADGGDDSALPPWFGSRWRSDCCVARCRQEASLPDALGHRFNA